MHQSGLDDQKNKIENIIKDYFEGQKNFEDQKNFEGQKNFEDQKNLEDQPQIDIINALKDLEDKGNSAIGIKTTRKLDNTGGEIVIKDARRPIDLIDKEKYFEYSRRRNFIAAAAGAIDLLEVSKTPFTQASLEKAKQDLMILIHNVHDETDGLYWTKDQDNRRLIAKILDTVKIPQEHLAFATNLQGLNFPSTTYVTISKGLENDEYIQVGIPIPGVPLNSELRREYNDLETKDWYLALSTQQQNLVSKYKKEIIKGTKQISAQLTHIPSIRNGRLNQNYRYNSENKKMEFLSEVLSTGAPGTLAKVPEIRQINIAHEQISALKAVYPNDNLYLMGLTTAKVGTQNDNMLTTQLKNVTLPRNISVEQRPVNHGHILDVGRLGYKREAIEAISENAQKYIQTQYEQSQYAKKHSTINIGANIKEHLKIRGFWDWVLAFFIHKHEVNKISVDSLNEFLKNTKNKNLSKLAKCITLLHKNRNGVFAPVYAQLVCNAYNAAGGTPKMISSIHCASGKDRTGLSVIVYTALTDKLDWEARHGETMTDKHFNTILQNVVESNHITGLAGGIGTTIGCDGLVSNLSIMIFNSNLNAGANGILRKTMAPTAKNNKIPPYDVKHITPPQNKTQMNL